MSHIFISHAERDGQVANSLGTELEKAGFRVWFYERDSLPGATYISQVAKALRECQAVVVIVSPESLKSDQVTNEIVRAYEGHKPFIPVLYGVTHEEFRESRDDWRQCLGASTSIAVPEQGVAAIVPRIARGLEHLGIKPGEATKPPEPKPTPVRAAEPTRPESKPEPTKPEPKREPAARPASVAPKRKPKLPALRIKLSPWLWAAIGGVVVIAAVVVAVVVWPVREDAEETPALLLNRLGVAVAPGGSEEVTVTATDGYHRPPQLSAECDSIRVATVTWTDSTIVVTGRSCGTANVTVSCDGDRGTFPVQVYDPMVLETDELLIGFVDKFGWRWNTSGDHPHATFAHPAVTDGFRPLGTLATPEFRHVGEEWAVVVKAKRGSDALRPPDDYRLLWSSEGVRPRWRDKYDSPGSFWLPVPPTGYRALGIVVQQGFGKPSLDDVVCVRQDLTAPGELGGSVVTRQGRPDSWAGKDGTLWEARPILPPATNTPHELCYLPTGAFSLCDPKSARVTDGPLSVLMVKLPLLAVAPPQVFQPRLTGYDEPPKYTNPTMAREVLVPWILVRDDALSTSERLRTTPFYRLERQVGYRRLEHHHNVTSLMQPFEVPSNEGPTDEERQTLSAKTAIDISVEMGVSCRFTGMGSVMPVGVTVSKELGYETTHGIAEFASEEAVKPLRAPPGKAVATWQEYNRFVLKRHIGSSLQPVATLEFGTDSYVTDEYPDD
ncbi:MAG: Vps62-related protein [candidate division WOR-3 bacterium]|nr:MAG: Vps62-related protein [candidate division WOR-3 bacterium]